MNDKCPNCSSTDIGYDEVKQMYYCYDCGEYFYPDEIE